MLLWEETRLNHHLLDIGAKNWVLVFIGNHAPHRILFMRDGTEVDLHVEHYVPYLVTEGDVTINRAACSYEIPSV